MSRARTDLRLRILERETAGLDFAVETALAAKQDNLVSGTNIKTVNGISLLGSGNVAIAGGGGINGGIGFDDNLGVFIIDEGTL